MERHTTTVTITEPNVKTSKDCTDFLALSAEGQLRVTNESEVLRRALADEKTRQRAQEERNIELQLKAQKDAKAAQAAADKEAQKEAKQKKAFLKKYGEIGDLMRKIHYNVSVALEEQFWDTPIRALDDATAEAEAILGKATVDTEDYLQLLKKEILLARDEEQKASIEALTRGIIKLRLLKRMKDERGTEGLKTFMTAYHLGSYDYEFSDKLNVLDFLEQFPALAYAGLSLSEWIKAYVSVRAEISPGGAYEKDADIYRTLVKRAGLDGRRTKRQKSDKKAAREATDRLNNMEIQN